MRHWIIGTAGHVDHGKTTLIKRLTGTDTDRLAEEKRRGITIENGFASLTFPDGQKAGIVDVPGHEKFIGNMLAGAWRVDAALLVIGADEGIRPQTVEHLDILSLLGVRRGVVAVTKTDLVDGAACALLRGKLRTFLDGSFLEKAPVVFVSALEEAGITELRQELWRLCTEAGEEEKGSFFLPVDRCFTSRGAGTVVTGTLAGGPIVRGREAVLYPSGLTAKIRGIQVYHEEVEQAFPGQRTALNLSGISREQIRRGDVLSPEGMCFSSMMLDVRLEICRHTLRRIKNGSRVHVYVGTAETVGKLILMEAGELGAGMEGYAQLRLEEAVAARYGERFVLRLCSPSETIGGGVVLDVCPRRHRRNQAGILGAFSIKEKGNAKERFAQACLESGGEYRSLRELAARCGISREEGTDAAQLLCREGQLYRLSAAKEVFIHRKEWERIRAQLLSGVEEYHRNQPLMEGMPRAQLAEKIRAAVGAGTERGLLELLTEEGAVVRAGEYVRLPGFVPQGREENPLYGMIEKEYLEAGYAVPTNNVLRKKYEKKKDFRQVCRALQKRQAVIALNAQCCIHHSFLEEALGTLREMARSGESVRTGEFRDALGCSRKTAIALLEYFDKSGYTEKTETGRRLRR